MNNYPPFHLRCEYLVNPLGIDVPKPRFSWLLNHTDRGQSQKAFQVIVSSTMEQACLGEGDIWDSGKVKSEKNFGVEYDGKPLASVSRYFWRVRWWDSGGQISPFSEIACFGTGLFQPTEWKAKWIGMKDPEVFESTGTVLLNKNYGSYENTKCIYLRKEFSAKPGIKQATVFISGLGFYELYINGMKMGDSVLNPGQTDYSKIALYVAHDVTFLLQKKNAVGVMLGNGRHLKKYGYTFPKLIFQMVLEYEDGRKELVVSDKTWKVSHGPLMENGIYYGEKYDSRLEMQGWNCAGFNDSKWENAVAMKGVEPGAQMSEPIRITSSIKPVKMWSPSDGVFIFDFGQNFTGWVKLKVRGHSGTEVKMRHAELIYDDGSLNVSPNQSAEATDIYILKGSGVESYEPRFTYHGFRYVELTGFPGVPTLETLTGKFLHSDVAGIGDFYCSNELINKIHTNCQWGQLSNLTSIPSDCPQRDERYGWLGDAHLAAEAAMFCFDMAAFYTKFMDDIKLAQRDDGALPDTAPLYLGDLYPADPAWGTAYVTLAWYLYEFYGDKRILEKHYESMKKYVEFLKKNSDNNVIKKLGKYGDWCPPGSIVPKKTPVELTSSWYYYSDTLNLSKIASILGKKSDAATFSKLADEIKTAFNKEFLGKDQYAAHRVSKVDSMVSQTSNILPLYNDIVPRENKKRILQKLVDHIVKSQDYHLDTGIVGTRYILDVLTDNGLSDVAFKVATQKTYPGWGYMVEEGATTLWERWEKITGGGMNSHNHIMLGSVDAWFFRVIAGISLLEPGWEKIRIKPHVFDLKFASSEVLTIKGLVKVSWQRGENAFEMHAIIPIGSDAEIHIPALFENPTLKVDGKVVFKNGKATTNTGLIKYRGNKDGCLTISVPNGYYTLSVEK